MKSYILFLFLLFALFSNAQQSDNGNGTYTNPIIWSDFPDPDVIRVGDTYYMVSTTMFVFPGVTLLKSYDLVNWEYCNNIVNRLTVHPAYNLEGGNRYAHGQWATSLRYYDGRFYALFFTLDEGGFLCTATDPEGNWKVNKLPKGFYDAGLFFDEDGRIYIAHGYSTLSITEVNPDLSPKTQDSITYKGTVRLGLEGWHVYKINGIYYLLCTYGGGDGFQACLRSKSIYGPYEEKIILRDDMNLAGKGVHQASLVQIQSGEYWSIIFQDRDGVGRVPTLQPVIWIDGWPILGVDGKAVVTYKKPNVGKSFHATSLPASDEFNETKLPLQWGWNHNPDNSLWSLTERSGFLRLKTGKVVTSIREARNTLTQRMYGPYSITTTEFHINAMKDGDIAGLCVFQNPYAYVAVKMENGKKKLVMCNNGQIVDSTETFTENRVYLKASAFCIKDKAAFSYSFDNKTFKTIGNELEMNFSLSIFTGNKFCLFNYATKEFGGYIDVNWFRMDIPRGIRNSYNARNLIEAENYDYIHGADTEKSADVNRDKNQYVVTGEKDNWICFDQIDFGNGVSKFVARASTHAKDGYIEIRLNSLSGTLLGICKLNYSNDKFSEFSTSVKPIYGKHKLFLQFCGESGSVIKTDWFYFK